MGVFFGDSPQLIGLSGDLSKRGSYFGVDELASPLLALRDMEGDFRVFVNACRQRGDRLLNGRGDTKKLVCPFHGRNKR